ncbi:NAD(P)-binding protein [Polyplosphaeria fusca]|uniref:NAD(P)-binding protein n=1 Tax=Polyplosphaeria fusca TaxID=682080 RepID=A0A9P4QWK4_9PLEO|nr:NAD(P)-binding protein [Polyplosphaeria fusca]
MPSYVIIGASRGIGYQFLKTLSADSSNTVIGTARNVSATESQLLKDGIKNVSIVSAEMDVAASMSAAAAVVAKITDSVDYLIINGGYISDHTAFISPTGYTTQEALFAEEFDKCMHTNTVGILYTVNAFLPLVKKSSVKKVTVISSGHADLEAVLEAEIVDAVPYALSKAAVNILVAKYAMELRGEGITFLSLSPGFVMTRAEDALKPGFTGPISPAESVDKCLSVIDQVGIEQTGQFLSHHGDKEWL